MNKFISFDGIDGSGKTTLARLVAEKIGGVYYYTPPKQIYSLREFADNSTPDVRYFFYMMGNSIASEEIKQTLPVRDVVADWYVYSTIAYHSVLLNKKLEIPESLILPNKVVRVTASWDEVKKRLDSREVKNKYESLDFLKKVSEKYDEIFSGLQNVIVVNTTNRDPRRVADEIVGKLK